MSLIITLCLAISCIGLSINSLSHTRQLLDLTREVIDTKYQLQQLKRIISQR